MATEREFEEGAVDCSCGESFTLYWNGGECDQHDCKCGRRYYTEHRKTVLVTLAPGETRA